ncbi:hypothetical protein [Streptomyces sp. NPDC089915]|uniref:hypothetical protein n=1 Tax=Streptomyces sp. NPDC089915 TaxID=3155186 RepID=UPI00342CA9AD
MIAFEADGLDPAACLAWGWIGPEELAAYVGRHVSGYTLADKAAGHLRAVAEPWALVGSGFPGVEHVPVPGRFWVAWPTPFLPGGKPVGRPARAAGPSRTGTAPRCDAVEPDSAVDPIRPRHAP